MRRLHPFNAHYSLGAWIPWVYFIFGYIFSFTPTNIFERAETAGVLEKRPGFRKGVQTITFQNKEN